MHKSGVHEAPLRSMLKFGGEEVLMLWVVVTTAVPWCCGWYCMTVCVCVCVLQELYDKGNSTAINGPIKYVYKNVDFSKVTVTLANGSKVCWTCALESLQCLQCMAFCIGSHMPSSHGAELCGWYNRRSWSLQL